MTFQCPDNPFSAPFPKSVMTASRKPLVDVALQVEGQLPQDLYGYAFVIGPIGSLDCSPIPGTPIIHSSCDGTPTFNGDAMIYRLDLDSVQKDGTIRLTSKIAKTPCFYTDQAAYTNPAYGMLQYGNHGLARLSPFLGFRNSLNTAFLPMRFNEAEGDRLLITWDAGRPYEIDTETLDIVTPIGWNTEWQEQIQLDLPFGIVTTTAHPAFDAYTNDDLKLFTLNYGKSIPTALEPVFSGSTDQSWQELNDFLQVLDDRLASVEQPLHLISTTEHQVLTSEHSPDWLNEVWMKVTKPILQQGLIQLHRLIVELETRLPWLSPIPNQYLKFWEGLVEVLEQELEKSSVTLSGQRQEKGSEALLKLVRKLRQLVDVLQKLVRSAVHMQDFVHLLGWDGQGKLQRWELLVSTPKGPAPIRIRQSMHQMAATQDYIVLMDTVFKLGAEQLLTNPLPQYPQIDKLLRDFLDFRESADTVLYIVRRADLRQDQLQAIAQKVVIPRGAAHFLADYENPDGKITLHLAHNTAWDPSEWTRPYDTFPYSDYPPLYGMSTGGMDVNHIGRYVIDGETGAICESTLLTDPQHTWMTAIYAYNGVMSPKRFKNIYWNSWGCWPELLPTYIKQSYEQYPYRELPVSDVLEITRRGLPVNLCRVDTEQMTVADYYEFPPGCFGYSAQFVPRYRSPGDRNAETFSDKGSDGAIDKIDESTDGYIICVVNTGDRPTHSEFWIFDAADLRRGGSEPLCKLSHPEVKLGLTVHSTWLPQIGPRRATYTIPAKADYDNRLKKNLMQDDHPEVVQQIQTLFETEVYPHFPAV